MGRRASLDAPSAIVEAQDPAAILRDHVAAVVTAVEELEEARQRIAKSATTLNDLIERIDSPVQGLQLSVDASMDLSRRARGFASDVVGDSVIALDEVPNMVDDAVEFQNLVEFFLARSAETAVA
jgi:hypothetical protein